MRYTELTLAVLLAVSLSGCTLRGKPLFKGKTPAAVKPVAPPPPVVAAKPAPPEPLSIPQTNVRLPEPQPISPEALATTVAPEEPAAPPTSPAPKPPTRRTAAPNPPATQPAAPEPER